MRKFQILLIVAAFLIASSYAVESETVNTFVATLIRKGLQKLETMTIPDFEEKGYKFSEVWIQNVTVPGDKIKFKFDRKRVSLSTESFGFEAGCLINGTLAKFIPIHFRSGISMADSSLNVTIAYEISGPSIKFTVEETKLKIRNLHFILPSNLAGKTATSLADLLQKPLQSVISRAASKALKKAIQKAVDDSHKQFRHHLIKIVKGIQHILKSANILKYF